jgi:DNA-binding protein H-NS
MPKLSADTIKLRIAYLQKQLIAVEKNKAPAIKKVKALMKKLGVTIEDLARPPESADSSARRHGRPGERASEKLGDPARTRKVAIKYRDERGNTWTGRGKTPRWLVDAEKAGKNRESFKV